MPHSPVTVRCRAIILHEGKLLLVRHFRKDTYADFYALPGGHIDYGEDPEECMRRELLEELGIEAKLGRLLFIHTLVRDDGTQSVEFFFEVTNGADFAHHETKDKTHAHEIAEVRWVGKEERVLIRPGVFARYFYEGQLLSDVPRFIKEE
jgi:8-oxo-dGTP pyrophosphatase MutT (NUDIX family)